jgi:hypothetical protein
VALAEQILGYCNTMQAYHINTTVTKDGEVHLPKLPFKPGQDVEVFIRPFDDDTDRREEKAWMEFGLRQFLDGYADEDSVYDAL